MLPAAVGVAAFSGLVAWLVATHGGFAPGACARAEAYLSQEVVGQDLAIRQLADAVCHHLEQPRPGKPLIVSAHGPPGVGKTLTHQLLARALYSQAPSRAARCPGRDCRGYKVFYGMDYLVAERGARLAALRDSLVAHLRLHPEALVVVEEYDKLDCDARALWRQLLQHPERLNITWDRAIVMLESNLGMSDLEQLLTSAHGRDQVSAEDAERRLRELVFSHWQRSSCGGGGGVSGAIGSGGPAGEDGAAAVAAAAAAAEKEAFEDTLKLTSLVDFYLPYFPLEKAHVAELARRSLARRGKELEAAKGLALAWSEEVVWFLVSKVEFSGPFPMEGAKGIESAVTRHVSRLLRQAPPQPKPPRQPGAPAGAGPPAAAAALVISYDAASKGLKARVVQRQLAAS